MKPLEAQPKQTPVKKYPVLETDSEGALRLPDDLMRDMGVNIGDEFALWKKGDEFILIFPKHYRGKATIPKPAHRGEVERAMPKILFLMSETRPAYKPSGEGGKAK